MKYKKISLIIISLIISAIGIKADDFGFKYELLKLQNSGDSTEILFNFSFPQNKVEFAKQGEYYVSNLELMLYLKSNSDTISKLWEMSTQAINPAEKMNLMFIGSKKITAKNGEYSGEIWLTDKNANKTSKFEIKTLSIPRGKKNHISDVVLAIDIKRKEEIAGGINPDFDRNGYYILPNTNDEIQGTKPEIIAYNEIYNIQNISALTFQYNILNGAKSKVMTEAIKISSDTSVYAKFNLDTLPSGLYYVEALLQNDKNQTIEKRQKKIYLINPKQKPSINVYFSEDEAFEKSEFSTFSEEKCEEEYKYINLIASKNEKELWKDITDLKAKQKFYFRFWENRRTDHSSLVNPARENFKDRIIEARKYYKELNNDDLSDREKIYIKYGKPIEVQTNTAQDGNRAYQSFFYSDLYGGAHFYFVDYKGNGVYMLVHSTMTGEIQNYDWETRFLKDYKQ